MYSLHKPVDDDPLVTLDPAHSSVEAIRYLGLEVVVLRRPYRGRPIAVSEPRDLHEEGVRAGPRGRGREGRERILLRFWRRMRRHDYIELLFYFVTLKQC